MSKRNYQITLDEEARLYIATCAEYSFAKGEGSSARLALQDLNNKLRPYFEEEKLDSCLKYFQDCIGGDEIPESVFFEYDESMNFYPVIPKDKVNRILSWEEALPCLTWKVDSMLYPSYNTIIWTSKYVYKLEYSDQGSYFIALPRNPEVKG